MQSENKKRQIVKIVTEICVENDIPLNKYSFDYILELEINKKNFYIIGYTFPNNDAAAQSLCEDKCALFEVLKKHNLPAVEHFFFMSPNNSHYIGASGNWESINSLLKKHGKLVVKTNRGNGGNDCFVVKNQTELEGTVHELFKTHRAIALSPFYQIEKEYRIIVLNNKAEIIYSKERASVTGNGQKTLQELIKEKYGNKEIEIDALLDLFSVPGKNEKVHLTWKHNLGKGAYPEDVEEVELKNNLSALALNAAETTGIKFASVDIVSINGAFRILEINSGIMMENYAAQNAENYAKAKAVYKKAIEALYAPKRKKTKEHKAGSAAVTLPLLNKAAQTMGAQINMDEEYLNYCIYTFKNGKTFVARDLPLNINYSGSAALATNKAATVYFLKKMGYSCPRTEVFSCGGYSETYKQLEEAVKKFSFPLVLKPNNLSQGQLVFKVNNLPELKNAFSELFSNCHEFLLQEFCAGKDYRVVVLGNKILQAYERIPFSITGDGQATVGSMLESRKKLYQQQGRDTVLDINDPRIFKALSEKGYNLSTVLPAGEKVFLQDISNLSLGGSAEDVTNKISPFFKNICLEIAGKLNFSLCGIDLFCEDITAEECKQYNIIEINSSPGLDNYLYNHISVQKQKEYIENLYAQIFAYLNGGN